MPTRTKPSATMLGTALRTHMSSACAIGGMPSFQHARGERLFLPPDHPHELQLIPVREGADTHDSSLGTGYPPYRYPGRKDAPMSGGQDEIAVRDRRLAVDVLEPGQIAVVSGEDRAPPTLADDHRHLGLEVGDQEHAGGAARNLGDAADEALAVDHGLPGGHPFAGAGIYEDGP